MPKPRLPRGYTPPPGWEDKFLDWQGNTLPPNTTGSDDSASGDNAPDEPNS